MKVLVLGATGFLGKNFIKKLQSEHISYLTYNRKDGCDLFNYEQFREFLLLNKPTVIVNLSAHVGSVHYVSKYSADVYTDNVQIILNIYRAVDSCRKEIPEIKIVNPMTNCSYPDTDGIQEEKNWLNGDVHDSVFSYGNVKRVLYHTSRCYYEQHGIKSVNYMFGGVYGYGDSTDANKTHALNGMIMRMIECKKNNDPEFVIWGTGKPIRDWIYVDDVCHFLFNGMYDNEVIYPINVTQGKGYSINELAETIKDVLKYKGKLINDTTKMDGSQKKILSDNIFKRKFGEYKFKDLKDGMEETIKYYTEILK